MVHLFLEATFHVYAHNSHYLKGQTDRDVMNNVNGLHNTIYLCEVGCNGT